MKSAATATMCVPATLNTVVLYINAQLGRTVFTAEMTPAMARRVSVALAAAANEVDPPPPPTDPKRILTTTIVAENIRSDVTNILSAGTQVEILDDDPDWTQFVVVKFPEAEEYRSGWLVDGRILAARECVFSACTE